MLFLFSLTNGRLIATECNKVNVNEASSKEDTDLGNHKQKAKHGPTIHKKKEIKLS